MREDLSRLITTIAYNLYVNFKSVSIYCGLRLNLIDSNPAKGNSEHLKLGHKLMVSTESS